MDFHEVREAFRRLFSSSPPHVAYVESWHMALLWLKAPVHIQLEVEGELQRDLEAMASAPARDQEGER